MIIDITDYSVLSALLFVIGVVGVLINTHNIIVVLMSIELALLAININFVAFSVYLGDILGQIFVLFNLSVAAAEAAIGLAILVVYFRNMANIAVDDFNNMRG